MAAPPQDHISFNGAGPNGTNAFECASKDISSNFIKVTCAFMDGVDPYDFKLGTIITPEIVSKLLLELERGGFDGAQIARVRDILVKERESMASNIFTSKFLKESRVISLPDRAVVLRQRSAWIAANKFAGWEALIAQLVAAHADGHMSNLKKAKYKVIPEEWEGGHEIQILYLFLFDMVCAHLVDLTEEKFPGTKSELARIQKTLCADMDAGIVKILSGMLDRGAVIHAQELRDTQLTAISDKYPGHTIVVANGALTKNYVQHTAVLLPPGWEVDANVSDDVHRDVAVEAGKLGEGVPDTERITAVIATDPSGRQHLLVSAHAGSGGESAKAMLAAATKCHATKCPGATFVMGMDSNTEAGAKVKGIHRDDFDREIFSIGYNVTTPMPSMKRARLPFQAQPLKRSVKLEGTVEDGELVYTLDQHPKDLFVVKGAEIEETTTFNRFGDDGLPYLENAMCPNPSWVSDHFAIRARLA